MGQTWQLGDANHGNDLGSSLQETYQHEFFLVRCLEHLLAHFACPAKYSTFWHAGSRKDKLGAKSLEYFPANAFLDQAELKSCSRVAFLNTPYLDCPPNFKACKFCWGMTFNYSNRLSTSTDNPWAVMAPQGQHMLLMNVSDFLISLSG
jgi:hypothetical protein